MDHATNKENKSITERNAAQELAFLQGPTTVGSDMASGNTSSKKSSPRKIPKAPPNINDQGHKSTDMSFGNSSYTNHSNLIQGSASPSSTESPLQFPFISPNSSLNDRIPTDKSQLNAKATPSKRNKSLSSNDQLRSSGSSSKDTLDDRVSTSLPSFEMTATSPEESSNSILQSSSNSAISAADSDRLTMERLKKRRDKYLKSVNRLSSSEEADQAGIALPETEREEVLVLLQQQAEAAKHPADVYTTFPDDGTFTVDEDEDDDLDDTETAFSPESFHHNSPPSEPQEESNSLDRNRIDSVATTSADDFSAIGSSSHPELRTSDSTGITQKKLKKKDKKNSKETILSLSIPPSTSPSSIKPPLKRKKSTKSKTGNIPSVTDTDGSTPFTLDNIRGNEDESQPRSYPDESPNPLWIPTQEEESPTKKSKPILKRISSAESNITHRRQITSSSPPEEDTKESCFLDRLPPPRLIVTENYVDSITIAPTSNSAPVNVTSTPTKSPKSLTGNLIAKALSRSAKSTPSKSNEDPAVPFQSSSPPSKDNLSEMADAKSTNLKSSNTESSSYSFGSLKWLFPTSSKSVKAVKERERRYQDSKKRAEHQPNLDPTASAEFEVAHIVQSGDKLIGPSLSVLRSSGRILKEDWVLKKKQNMSGWKKRYMAIDRRRIYVYKSKTNINKPPKRIIVLAFATCKETFSKEQKLSTFELFTPDRKFRLATQSSIETKNWISLITTICDNILEEEAHKKKLKKNTKTGSNAKSPVSSTHSSNTSTHEINEDYDGEFGVKSESNDEILVAQKARHNQLSTGQSPSIRSSSQASKATKFLTSNQSDSADSPSGSLPSHTYSFSKALSSSEAADITTTDYGVFYPPVLSKNSKQSKSQPAITPSSLKKSSKPGYTSSKTGNLEAAFSSALTSSGSTNNDSYNDEDESTARSNIPRYTEEVAKLREMNGNDRCADCSAMTPEWAVANLGTFVCIECSGIHRSFGNHISRVRSLTLDKWDEQQISWMRQIGNIKANSAFEHSVPSHIRKPKASATVDERKAWITNKYINRAYFDHNQSSLFPATHR